MKIKFITSAGVTTASIQTELSPKIRKTVKGYKPEAFKIFNEDGKMTFGVGVSKESELSKDKTILNFAEVKETETYTYREVLLDASKEEKDELKVKFVALSKQLEVVEKQVLEAYAQYQKEAASIKEVNLDEATEVVERGKK